MRGFELKELLLISLKEQRARKVKFHPKTTVIKGKNDTGKSSLLKSIYRCFGATSQRINDKWKGADVRGIVTFSVQGKIYRIAEEGRRYTVFNGLKEAIESFTSVTNGLGPYLARLLTFELKLISRENEVVTPPPAYMFLPFYIDQDVGWIKAWDSFTNLGQFSDWKKTLAEYFTGIRPNEYYTAKGESDALAELLKPLAEKHALLKSVLLGLQERMKLGEFSLDIERYREEIRELLVVCDRLKKKEEEIKASLVMNYNAKTSAEAQIAIVQAALSELHADYAFATEKLLEDTVECPTCGVKHANSFVERFSIAQDEDRCHDLLADLTKDLDVIDRRIKVDNAKYTNVSADFVRISELLQTKQGDVKLKDLIESEGRKEVQRIISADIRDISAKMDELKAKIDVLKARMQEFDNKDRRSEITNQFRQSMKDSLVDLDVHTLTSNKLHVYSDIKETGSDMPRAILAYYFSILHLIHKHAASQFCPLVIDSPNQQDQDPSNLKKMLKFIRDERPESSQLVLGLVDDCGLAFDGEVIELTDKLHLLQEDGYKKLLKEAMDYFEKARALARSSDGRQ